MEASSELGKTGRPSMVDEPSARDGWLGAALAWLGRHELSAILTVVVLTAGALLFVKLAGEVSSGDTSAIDRTLLLSLRSPADIADPIGPGWVEELGRDMTALGGGAVLSLVSLMVCGYLLLLRKSRAAGFVAFAVISSSLASLALKHMFQRPRPDLVPHFSKVMTTSFPSGHSMLSAAVYLTLAGLLARMHKSRAVRAYVLLWGGLLSVLVGLSRVYVGVHWPTDVLAGWSAGAAWAALCWLIARTLQRRGELEAPAS